MHVWKNVCARVFVCLCVFVCVFVFVHVCLFVFVVHFLQKVWDMRQRHRNGRPPDKTPLCLLLWLVSLRLCFLVVLGGFLFCFLRGLPFGCPFLLQVLAAIIVLVYSDLGLRLRCTALVLPSLLWSLLSLLPLPLCFLGLGPVFLRPLRLPFLLRPVPLPMIALRKSYLVAAHSCASLLYPTPFIGSAQQTQTNTNKHMCTNTNTHKQTQAHKHTLANIFPHMHLDRYIYMIHLWWNYDKYYLWFCMLQNKCYVVFLDHAKS